MIIVYFDCRRCSEMGIEGFGKALPKFLLGGSLGGCIAVMMALQEARVDISFKHHKSTSIVNNNQL